MNSFASTTTSLGRPSGTFVPQPRTIPNPNSLGPLPRPSVDEPAWKPLYETRKKKKKKKRSEPRLWRCHEQRARCSQVETDDLQAEPAQQPLDSPAVRQQILAHDSAISRASDDFEDESISPAWEYEIKFMYLTLRRIHADNGFPAFVKSCSLFVWRTQCWLLQLRMYRSSCWIVQSMAFVLWWVCTVLANIVFSIGMLFLCAGYCLRGLPSVAREVRKNDEIRCLMGSIFRGLLSCYIVCWALVYAAQSILA
ncbi:hypothetical protein PG991_008883 [Apiospora marii]|uniref:PRA1 family protein n=1 Tax=Apiospora marii TaxID=335849 RepID=A0ABR1RND5_9PEZI